jgi:hypothetical protein
MHATCAIGIEILQQILASDSLAIPSLIVIKKIDFGVAINVRIKRDGGGAGGGGMFNNLSRTPSHLSPTL